MSEAADLSLDGELTVYAVHELQPRLLQALDAHTPLRLDLSEVAEIDGAGVQLLLATAREAQQRGGQLAICAAAPCVADTLQLLGLGDLLPMSPGEHEVTA